MEAGGTPPPGSFLSHFHQDLDDPDGLGSFNITHEEERRRRGAGEGKCIHFHHHFEGIIFLILLKNVLVSITAGPQTLHHQPGMQS